MLSYQDVEAVFKRIPKRKMFCRHGKVSESSPFPRPGFEGCYPPSRGRSGEKGMALQKKTQGVGSEGCWGIAQRSCLPFRDRGSHVITHNVMVRTAVQGSRWDQIRRVRNCLALSRTHQWSPLTYHTQVTFQVPRNSPTCAAKAATGRGQTEEGWAPRHSREQPGVCPCCQPSPSAPLAPVGKHGFC